MLTNEQKRKIRTDWEKSLIELLDVIDVSDEIKSRILRNEDKLLAFLKATEIMPNNWYDEENEKTNEPV